jgi:hypothetical protein
VFTLRSSQAILWEVCKLVNNFWNLGHLNFSVGKNVKIIHLIFDVVGIESAFDNTAFGSFCREAEEHGVELDVVSWIHAILNSRQILTTEMGHVMRVSVSWGCPQGGVLSPLLWSLVANRLLVQLNKEGLYTQRYADDLAMLITGKFPGIVSELMQRALY